ncbi:hypothetical protein COU59_03410 [Candidatus Pacearchaeota archaeon CG10_big_fil_rev_8_21_14_0_10_34_12]|nr:MAG: hypothetical protein COU59_03410 [Candidatus Pacearchaeota archaeon CG10_big_fil_rev_8_21_14_0_10_34_12]
MNHKFYLILGILVLFSFNFPLVLAHGGDTFAKAEEIINQKTPCNDLTDNDLEILGDYYMEQMHPGEQHEIMDEMMGGEDSESLRQIHVNMGKSFYCNDNSGGMMGGYGGMMNMRMGGSYGLPYGMHNYGYRTNYFAWVFNLLLIAALILIIILIIKQINKPKKHKRGRK